jgi:hypothetical protein
MHIVADICGNLGCDGRERIACQRNETLTATSYQRLGDNNPSGGKLASETREHLRMHDSNRLSIGHLRDGHTTHADRGYFSQNLA